MGLFVLHDMHTERLMVLGDGKWLNCQFIIIILQYQILYYV